MYVDEAEKEIITLAQQGCSEALNKIMSKYKQIIQYKAKSYCFRMSDIDDYCQEGMIALSEAVDSYNPNKQAQFNTFAEICIERKIISYLRKQTNQKNELLTTSLSIYEINPTKKIETQVISPIANQPENIFEVKILFEDVKKCIIRQLSYRETKVINLYLKEYTRREIMEVTGLSYKKIDNGLQRAITKLRKCIENKGTKSFR